MLHKRHPLVVAPLLIPLLVTGCGRSRPPVVPVTGKVTFKQTTPAHGALVVFHPVDHQTEKLIGGKPVGRVQEDGSFMLTTYEEGDGAPEGEYGVTIDWRGPPAEKGKFRLTDEGTSGVPRLQPKYSNPQQPFTKVTVKKGEVNHFVFDVD